MLSSAKQLIFIHGVLYIKMQFLPKNKFTFKRLQTFSVATLKKFMRYNSIPIRKHATKNDLIHAIIKHTERFTKRDIGELPKKSNLKIQRIFTDGSYKKKIKKGGFGVYFSNNDPRNVSARSSNSTSNKEELKAISKALSIVLKENKKNTQYHIFSDSKYSINSVTKWHNMWKLTKWKTFSRKDVKNKALIQGILKKLSKIPNIEFIHVKAHKKMPLHKNSLEYEIWNGNKNADALSKGEKQKLISVF